MPFLGRDTKPRGLQNWPRSRFCRPLAARKKAIWPRPKTTDCRKEEPARARAYAHLPLQPVGVHISTSGGKSLAFVIHSTKVDESPFRDWQFPLTGIQYRGTSVLMTLSQVGHSSKLWPSCRAVDGKMRRTCQSSSPWLSAVLDGSESGCPHRGMTMEQSTSA